MIAQLLLVLLTSVSTLKIPQPVKFAHGRELDYLSDPEIARLSPAFIQTLSESKLEDQCCNKFNCNYFPGAWPMFCSPFCHGKGGGGDRRRRDRRRSNDRMGVGQMGGIPFGEFGNDDGVPFGNNLQGMVENNLQGMVENKLGGNNLFDGFGNNTSVPFGNNQGTYNNQMGGNNLLRGFGNCLLQSFASKFDCETFEKPVQGMLGFSRQNMRKDTCFTGDSKFAAVSTKKDSGPSVVCEEAVYTNPLPGIMQCLDTIHLMKPGFNGLGRADVTFASKELSQQVFQGTEPQLFLNGFQTFNPLTLIRKFIFRNVIMPLLPPGLVNNLEATGLSPSPITNSGLLQSTEVLGAEVNLAFAVTDSKVPDACQGGLGCGTCHRANLEITKAGTSFKSGESATSTLLAQEERWIKVQHLP